MASGKIPDKAERRQTRLASKPSAFCWLSASGIAPVRVWLTMNVHPACQNVNTLFTVLRKIAPLAPPGIGMTTRIAIFSDLHGNSAATEAVLAAIDAEAPDAIYSLGDLVGYGAKPNETIDLIRERGIPTIMGNYDDGVGFDRDDCGCAYKDKDEEARGQQSLFWTRAATTRGEQGLPAHAPAGDPLRGGGQALPPGARLTAADERVPVRRSGPALPGTHRAGSGYRCARLRAHP